MSVFLDGPTDSPEITIEKLVPDEQGNLRATLFIPIDNRQAYKLFCETFFERQVRDALLKFKGPEKTEKAGA